MTDGSGDHPAAASLTQLRDRVVAQVMETSQVRDERIVAALRDVPRHLSYVAAMAVAALLSVTRWHPRELGP